jgi:hypothetical protein
VDEPKLTQAGLVCGTPEYMSPEQARGADLDARTDLYSMGVILYQVATGELPFQSDTPVGFLTKHLSEAPVPARQRRADVSERLEAVISRAMEKDPARRFQSADEMRDALIAVEPALAGAPARAGAAAPAPGAASPAAGGTSGRAPARTPRKSRALFWAFAGVVVVAAAGGGAVTLLAKEKVAERRGHPDTISPAQAQAAAPAVVPAATATSTATPTATSTATPTPTATSTSTATPEPAPVAKPAQRKVAPAAKRDPAKALALYRKGEARRAEQDIDGAIKLYLAAESSDPRLAEVQKKLALCYQLKGDTRRAADRYRRYLATRPADAERVRAILSTLE